MTTENKKKISPAETHAAKRLARLAAAQALYEASFAQTTAAQIVNDTIELKFATLFEDSEISIREIIQTDGDVFPDAALFGELVLKTDAAREEIDAALAEALDNKISGDRMEVLLRVVLRLGVCELMFHPKVPIGVIINDYVDVTRAFFNAKEPGLVNAVLDRLGKKIRK